MKKNLFLCSALLIVSASASADEWIVAGLNKIQASGPGSTVVEGVWFGQDALYTTSYPCTKKSFISIKDRTLADRALSMALYAKATSGILLIGVNGCDSQGFINGVDIQLVPQ